MLTPEYLIMYEIQGDENPKFHILFNSFSKDAKLLELEEDKKVKNIQLFDIKKVEPLK